MQGNVLGSSMRFFDIKNESQLIALLKEVRHSTLDNETKDDIRDVIFELNNNPSDTLLAELQLYLEPLFISVVEGSAESLPDPVGDSLPEVTQETVVIHPKPSLTGRTRPVPQMSSNPVVPVQIPEVQVVKDENITTEVNDNSDSVSDAEKKSEEKIAPESIAPISVEEAQARISEIKHIVNTAVGNPVNLIDSDNVVGREYMNSLLEAMKAVPAGGAALASAMKRLEESFIAVEKVISKTGVESVINDQPAPVVEITDVVDAEIKTSTESEAKSGYAAYVPSESANTAADEVKAEAVPASEFTTPSVPKPPAASSSNSVAAFAAERAMKIAAETSKEEVASAPSDPLSQPAVTSGLEQLLSEWKIFKSSGLFGTGPSGVNHPLYTNMRNVPMNLIISGRFEGVTPEVRQSVTDYMNGWRYEQGMTHDMQETFEHYLKRVIKVIIDKRASTVA